MTDKIVIFTAEFPANEKGMVSLGHGNEVPLKALKAAFDSKQEITWTIDHPSSLIEEEILEKIAERGIVATVAVKVGDEIIYIDGKVEKVNTERTSAFRFYPGS